MGRTNDEEEEKLKKETKDTKTKTPLSQSAFQRFVMRILAWVWDQIKLPIVLIGVFWMAGFGFYHGVIQASKIGELTLGKAMIITVVDLSKGENAEDDD